MGSDGSIGDCGEWSDWGVSFGRQACLVEFCLLQQIVDAPLCLHDPLHVSGDCGILVSAEINDFFDLVLDFCLLGGVDETGAGPCVEILADFGAGGGLGVAVVGEGGIGGSVDVEDIPFLKEGGALSLHLVPE